MALPSRLQRSINVTGWQFWIDRGGTFTDIVAKAPNGALSTIKRDGLRFRPMETTYFLGRETLIPSKNQHGMAVWREKLFSVMSKNARPASSFFRLPPNRVVELGAQVEL